jgi:hypothetical protein
MQENQVHYYYKKDPVTPAYWLTAFLFVIVAVGFSLIVASTILGEVVVDEFLADIVIMFR